MRILKIILLLAPLVFLGCAQNQNAKPSPNVAKSSKETKPQAAATSSKTATAQSASASSACKMGDIEGCDSFAYMKYQSGDFHSAINAYDMNCAKQHIPSCVKMAKMFEKGEGVTRNLDDALDIYMRACYSGHSRSCADMKRLEKLVN